MQDAKISEIHSDITYSTTCLQRSIDRTLGSQAGPRDVRRIVAECASACDVTRRVAAIL